MILIHRVPQPVIAHVHGIATAAGCQLVASCDLAVAAETAQFSTPGVKIGCFCTKPMVAVSRNIGMKKALEMLFTGKYLSARDALFYGLVNRVVPEDDLENETWNLAKDIAQYSLVTLGIGKEAFYNYNQIEMEERQAWYYAKEVISLNSQLPDAVEGITAFLDKKNPVWEGE